MITWVYICDRCKGGVESRKFDVEYNDMRAAAAAPRPCCPHCGSDEFVTRFFGHNVFCGPKSNKGKLPERYVPMDGGAKAAVISLGMRIDEEERAAVEEAFKHLVESGKAEGPVSPNSDIPGEKLGLKKGTLDRALFDIRHKRMLEELAAGQKFSGFFLPLSGETGN